MSIKLALFIFALSFGAFAEKGADLFLKQTKQELKEAISIRDKQYKIQDPFLIGIYAKWKFTPSLGKDFDTWMDLVFSKKYEEAYKSYDKFSKKSEYTVLLKFYLLKKLGLAQSFFDSWLEFYSKNENSSDPLFTVFNQVVSMDADAWIYNNRIYFSDKARTLLKGLDERKSRFVAMSNAWLHRKNGQKSLSYLGSLPLGSPMKLELGKRSVYYLAVKERLAEAAKVLKTQVWPEVKNANNPYILADYYMTIARLLYQVGQYEPALEFYKKIPNSLSLFIEAKTEMAWIYLRNKDYEKAQAMTKKLNHQLVKDYFYPELYLVESFADLARCRYREVGSDLGQFVNHNKKWAKEIDKNESGQRVNIQNDLVITYMKETKNALLKERNYIQELMGTVDTFNSYLKDIEAQVIKQENRYFANRKMQIEKAYFKMRFVKIAYLAHMDSVKRNKKKEYVQKVRTLNSSILKGKHMAFPIDGVFWPDELFSQEVKAGDRCPQG